MKRHYPSNPQLEPIKGIFVFSSEDDSHTDGLALVKELHCEVLSDSGTRVTVKTSRGNLQSIKKWWQAQDEAHPMSQKLRACVSNIIIGGKA